MFTPSDRLRQRELRGLAALCLIVVGSSHALAQADIESAVSSLQRRYASVQSVAAEFRQTYRAPGVEQSESGSLWMKKPGLMRWEYRIPEAKFFIADGHNTYLYTPEDRQVMIRPFSAAELHATPFQFLLGQGEILKNFKIAWEKEMKPKSEGTLLLRFVPRAAGPDYAFLVLECDEKTFGIRRIVIREESGGTSEFLLSNLTTNLKIDPKQFQFKVPKGVEVVRLEEK